MCEVVNQKGENVFERPKKKPVSGAQRERVSEYSGQLAEPGRPNKGGFLCVVYVFPPK